jgi:hypothetical protein
MTAAESFGNADVIKFLSNQDWRFDPEKEEFSLFLFAVDGEGVEAFIKNLEDMGCSPVVELDSKMVNFTKEGGRRVLQIFGEDFPVKISSKFLQHQNWSYATVGSDANVTDAYRISLNGNETLNAEIKKVLGHLGIVSTERYSESLGSNVLQIKDRKSVGKIEAALGGNRVDQLKKDFSVDVSKYQIAGRQWQEHLSHGTTPVYLLNVSDYDAQSVKGYLKALEIECRINPVQSSGDSIIVVEGDTNLRKMKAILGDNPGGSVTEHLNKPTSGDPDFIFGGQLPPRV